MLRGGLKPSVVNRGDLRVAGPPCDRRDCYATRWQIIRFAFLRPLGRLIDKIYNRLDALGTRRGTQRGRLTRDKLDRELPRSCGTRRTCGKHLGKLVGSLKIQRHLETHRGLAVRCPVVTPPRSSVFSGTCAPTCWITKWTGWRDRVQRNQLVHHRRHAPRGNVL